MDSTTTALIEAARRGDLPAINNLLLEQPRRIDVRDDRGYTPLIVAAYNGQYEATKLLLAAGADVNAQDAGGNTALMGVSFKGYPVLATLLIDHGADLNLQHGNGGTALMFATLFGRNELVRILLDAGADATLTDMRGLSHWIWPFNKGTRRRFRSWKCIVKIKKQLFSSYRVFLR